jgi:DNA-binding transcriptional regulator YhcF (GntR family)
LVKKISKSTLAIQELIIIDKQSSKPVYKQIVDQFINLIQNGTLGKNQKLPAQRDFASYFGISRATVNKAYDLLKQSGVLKSIHGSGFYINEEPEIFLSKRQKAFYSINKLYDSLIDSGFSFSEIRNLLFLLLEQKENNKDVPLIALIDCNIESLTMFEKQLKSRFRVSICDYLIPKLKLYIDKKDVDEPGSENDFFKTIQNINFNDFDLILTTVSHYHFIINTLKGNHEKVFRLSVAPDHNTLIQLGSIKKEERLLVLSTSQRFSEIVKYYLDRFNIKNDIHFFSFINEEVFEGKDILSDYDFYQKLKESNINIDDLQNSIPKFDCIIVPSKDAIDKNDFLKKIYLENQQNLRWILFEYKIEDGSMIALEEVLSKIMFDKIKDIARIEQ